MASRRRFWHVLALALVAVTVGVVGCSTTPSEDGKPKQKVEPTGPHAAVLKLFPSVGDVSDWKAASGDVKVFGPVANPAEKVELVDTDVPALAATLKGYGYVKNATRKYTRGQNEAVTLRIFEMKGPQDAYGVFSVSSTGTTFPNIGLAARMSTTALALVKGSFFVTVEYSGAMDPTPVLMDFGRWVADQIATAGYRPALLDNFPLNSLEGERYYLHVFPTLAALPFVPKGDPAAMARALSLTPDTDMAIVGYKTAKAGAPNYLFVIKYATDADAQVAYKMYYESYLAQSKNPAELNIAVSPPSGRFLAGTFNAEENSVDDQLGKLCSALGG